MSAIGECGPTQEQIEQWKQEEFARRQSYQNSLLERICDTLGNDVIKIAKIYDGKTTWQGNRISQLITPKGHQLMCLTESIMANVLIRVEDIFVVGYTLEQTNRNASGVVAGTIIQDIKATGECASGSDARVWSQFSSRGGYAPDDTARSLDISYANAWGNTEERSVPDYTISPVFMIAQNPRFGQQGKVMD